MPKELIELRRSNPDTDGYPWACWKNNYWSVPIYILSDDPKLYRINMKWYNVKDNTIDDKPPKEWIDFFGDNNPQNEHPNELSAVYISNYIKDKNIISKAMEILINVFKY
jgi:hypothetical protein